MEVVSYLYFISCAHFLSMHLYHTSIINTTLTVASLRFELLFSITSKTSIFHRTYSDWSEALPYISNSFFPLSPTLFLLNSASDSLVGTPTTSYSLNATRVVCGGSSKGLFGGRASLRFEKPWKCRGLGFVLLFATLVCCQPTELILGFFFCFINFLRFTPPPHFQQSWFGS